MRIKWLGHASFEIEAEGSIIHIDPYILSGSSRKADVVLITHDHFDHCGEDALRRVSKEGALVISPQRAARKIPRTTKVASVGDVFDHKGIQIRVVPAYVPGSAYHPKGHGVGYVIDAGGKRLYHAGDTAHIPEMGLIDEVTVALLPVGGPHTMTVEEAVKAVQTLSAGIVVPMHYGHFQDSVADIHKFKRLVEASSSTRVEDLSNQELHV
ncbi:MAG: hypothetical protein COT21_00780 [Hadesarchaea archaeon CG08_land_8_20_14_0_20_51_8]|nr:MAG: hypothetical protein COT21_00780 [Hadesarchaea archaeon CG08_land_8_20_14_0_20_51_8]